MKTILCTLCCLFALASYGQERPKITIDIPSDQKPWSNLNLNNDPGNFQFAIVTDRTGGHRPGVFMKGVRKLNLLRPEFVMSVGDLIEGYTTDTARLNAEWKEFNGFIDSLRAPFFYVPGNHDITNQVMEDKWMELFGVSWYHFVYQDVLFLCLNSEDNLRGAGRGTLDDEQFAYVEKVLKENKNVKWTLVFLHQPLWIQNDTKRWKDVEELLSDRPHNVFAGHYHRYWKTERNNGKYIALATTGGGSALRGTAYGEFDHVVWATMTDEGPILANLLLEGVWDEDVVTNELVDFVRNRPFPIRVEPIFVDDAVTASVTTEVRITNDSDFRMKASINGATRGDLHYYLDEPVIEVEPNSVEIRTLHLENTKGLELTNTDPIRLDMEAVYDYPGRPELAVKNSLKLRPLLRTPLKKADKKVKVDGKLKEWSGEWMDVKGLDHISRNRFHYEGDQDLSMSFRTAYDDSFFYVAATVRDDELFADDQLAAWQQDALIIALDVRAKSISGYNRGAGRGQDWLYFIRNLTKEDNVFTENSLPEGTTMAVTRNKSGFDFELAIPRSYIERVQGSNWQTIRLGIGYYDWDKGGKERNDLFWLPAWNSGETIDGSGMLFRE